jgi:hypothetical protein
MIVALAGRRVDAPTAQPERFPLANVERVRARLRDLMQSRGAEAIVSSAACGADLLGQQVAHEMGIRRIVVLPYPLDVFRERSVADRPGEWGALYDELVADKVGSDVELVLLGEPIDAESSQGAYERTNGTVLERARRAAARADANMRVMAIVVWDGAPRGPDDITEDFRRSALSGGMEVVEVPTT